MMTLPSLRASEARVLRLNGGQWGQIYDRIGQPTGAYVVVWAVVVAGAAPRSSAYEMALSAGEITYPPTGGQEGVRAWDLGVVAAPGVEGALMNGPPATFYVPPGHTLHVGAPVPNAWRFTAVVAVDGVLPAVQPVFAAEPA